METIELEVYKCPFCGSVPILNADQGEGAYLCCDCENISGESSENLEDVIESWNAECRKNAAGGGC